jgi:hypothetical protein
MADKLKGGNLVVSWRMGGLEYAAKGFFAEIDCFTMIQRVRLDEICF